MGLYVVKRPMNLFGPTPVKLSDWARRTGGGELFGKLERREAHVACDDW
jgi:hypothetical protein